MADSGVIEIPWGVVLSLALFGIVLFYFLFFQQYLTALIFRLCFTAIPQKQFKIDFSRIVCSFLSGHITLFDVTIITNDMSIKISKFVGQIYYWRKIPDFLDTEQLKPRFLLQLFGLEITIFNRTWSTDLVQEVRKKFEEGKSTEEIGKYILSLYPEPKPYQLSILLRMILPLKIRIYASSLMIGNPIHPATLIFRSESISGYYTFIPRKSILMSIQSFLDVDINKLTMKSIPQNIPNNPWFNQSMRNIFYRSRNKYKIMTVESLGLRVLTDMYGLYVHSQDEQLALHVTKEPEMYIDATFNNSDFCYGPYLDKLRRYFMEFYAPFLYNDPLLYPDPQKRIKYWVINLYFPDRATFELPFVTEHDLPANQSIENRRKTESKEKRSEKLFIDFGQGSQFQMYIPNYIGSYAENKMEVNATLKDINIRTTIPGNNPNSNSPSIISSKSLNLNVSTFYPEQWNATTRMTVLANFDEAMVVLAPYHIDFLTQFGTDFAAWYPFAEPETLETFFPYHYYITLSFQQSVFKLFTESTPQFECFNNPEAHPYAEIRTTENSFKLSLPLLNYQEQKKNLTFSYYMGKTKVNFYYPDNHMLRIRRGTDKIYDFVTFERLVMPPSSYRWCLDPHGDCQIPVNIRVSNANGTFTIGTLVSLMGTLANYTSRKRKTPKQWHLKDPPTVFEYINNTSVIVSIDKGTLKVPLDLYDPDDGAIAHASNILIGVQGYHPFWHVLVDIGCAYVQLPRTNYPYDTFFNQNVKVESCPEEGVFHVDSVHITMKSISTFTGVDYVEVQNKIGCEIGRIDGYALMPQLICGLEIAWNIIHSFFSDDQFPIPVYDPFYIYRVQVFRICIGSIHVYLDMGSLGLLAAMLPGGVIVYSDTLVDDNANYVIFVHLPSIDAHLLYADKDGDPPRAILRCSTYLNVVRDIHYDNNENDAMRQIQMLKMYDIRPHPERYPLKINYYSYLFNFINQEKSRIDRKYLEIPPMMRPETYTSSLNEHYEFTEIYLSNPLDGNRYTLPLPELHYDSYKTFINTEDGIKWLHRYETYRFYTHLTPSRQSNKIPQIDPSDYRKVFYEEDKKRAHYSHGAIRLVIPNHVLVQLRPEALANINALLTTLNLMPNQQLMAKIVRSTVGDEYDLRNYHSSTINVILPQICVLLRDKNMEIVAMVENVNVRLVKKVNPVVDTNLTLYIKQVSLACSYPQNENASVTLTIPDISFVKVNDNGAVSIEPIKLYLASKAPKLINVILSAVLPYLQGLQPPSTGDRAEELVRLIKASPKYARELRNIKRSMFYGGECNTRFEVNCELSAYYAVLRTLDLHNYTQLYKMISVPPKEVTNSRLKMVIHPPEISISVQSSIPNGKKNKSSLRVNFIPVIIEKENETTSISCGIKSLHVDLMPDIISFIKNMVPKNNKIKKSLSKNSSRSKLIDYSYDNYEEDYESGRDDNIALADESYADDEGVPISSVMSPQKVEQKSNSVILLHAVINQISATFSDFVLNLDNVSLALALHMSELTNFSVTASFSNFLVYFKELASVTLKGIELTHESDTGQGFIHIKPITANIFLEFLLNPKKHMEPALVNLLTSETENDDNNESSIEFSAQSLVQKNSKFDLSSILKTMPTSLLIDDLNFFFFISTKRKLSLVFPKAWAFLFATASQNTNNFFAYFHEPTIGDNKYMNFSMPSSMFNVKLQRNLAEAIVMIGDIQAKGNSKQLSYIAFLMNEILSKFDNDTPNSEQRQRRRNTETSYRSLSPVLSSARTAYLSPKGSNTEFRVLLKVEIPKFEVLVKELESQITLDSIQFKMLVASSNMAWKFDIGKISANTFESNLLASIKGQNTKKTGIKLDVTPLTVTVSHELFSKLPIYNKFIDTVVDGFKQQQHVNTLFHQLNEQIQHSVENRADKLLSIITPQSKDDDLYNFPTLIQTTVVFAISQIDLNLILPLSGLFEVQIPKITLDVQLRGSKMHSKIAVGAQFAILDLGVIIYPQEKKQMIRSKNDQLSSLHIKAISISAVSYQNQTSVDSIIDGLRIELFPTFPKTLANFLLAISSISGILTKMKEQKTEKSALSKVRINVPSEFEDSPKRYSINTKNPIGRRKSLIGASKSQMINFQMIDEKPKKKEKKLEIIGHFSCIKTEIVLLPISNHLPIPAIEVQCALMNKDMRISLTIKNKVYTSLTPSLIGWLDTLRAMLVYLSRDNQEQMQEQYMKQQKKKREKKAKKNKQKALIENEEILSFSKGLPFTVYLTVFSNDFQIRFSCQPRRNDVSCEVGISCIAAAASTETNTASLCLSNLYLRTHNEYAMHSQNDQRVTRLFEFNIPQISIGVGLKNLTIGIEKIFTSFSSDKIEEISLFNDIWFQPILKLLKDEEIQAPETFIKPTVNEPYKRNASYHGPLSQSEHFSDNPRQIGSDSHGINSQDRTNSSINDESTLSDEEEDISETPTTTLSRCTKNVFLEMNIVVSIQTVEFLFNYASGAGNLDLTFSPIRISKTPNIALLTVNQISCNSAGPLLCKLDVEGFLLILSNIDNALMSVGQIQSININLSMSNEPFLLFNLNQTNLLCRIHSEDDIEDAQTILQLSVDSPDIKMTALTVPTLKTFIKTIMDPIIAGVARANRSEKTEQLQGKYDASRTKPPAPLPKDKRMKRFNHLLANLDVLISKVKIVLLRYDFRDNDAVMFEIKAAMLHLGLLPDSKGMKRTLRFQFLPISLSRFTNTDLASSSFINSSQTPLTQQSSGKLFQRKKGKGPSKMTPIVFSDDEDDAEDNNYTLKDSKNLRYILKLPKINGVLDTLQKDVSKANVSYNFITDFSGNIEPTLNLSDYEMLLALIKYTIANLDLNKGDGTSEIKNDELSEDTESIFGSYNSGKSRKSHNEEESFNSKEKEKEKEQKHKTILKTHYHFTPLKYKFAPGFKVGLGAAINPDIAWLLARFGISDEHLIPASLFEFLCIGLEKFLEALTNSMTQGEKDQ